MRYSLIALVLSCAVYASEAPIRLEKFYPMDGDVQENLIQGGRFFATRCMSCHSLKLFTHNEIGRLSGVTADKMVVHDNSWGSNPPPDLSLVTRYRGVDWVYTYLLSYYANSNLLLNNTSMPDPFLDLRGKHSLIIKKDKLLRFADLDDEDKPPWYRLVNQTDAGNITSEELNNKIITLVMFLDYVAEPTKKERLELAPWVLIFLGALFLIAWQLNKSYWQDVG